MRAAERRTGEPMTTVKTDYMSMLTDIIKRYIGVPTPPKKRFDEEDLDKVGRAELKPWEKGWVLTSIFNGALACPCVGMMLATGCTHAEAHEALDQAECVL